MNKAWQLHEAKNRLSEVVERAAHDGPQIVTVRGKPAAVLLSIDDYRKLTEPRVGLVDFFRQSPLHGVELDLERSRDTGRSVAL